MPYPLRSILQCGLGLLLAGCATSPPPTTEPTATPAVILSDSLDQVWVNSIEGPLNSSPVRADDVVLVAAQNGSLTALDIETGEIAWEFAPTEGLWDRSIATDGKQIYVGLQDSSLVALDAETGDMLWRTDLAVNMQISPLVDDDTLYVSTTFVGPSLSNDPDEKAILYVIEASSGEILWEVQTDNYILQTPFRYEDILYVGGNFNGETKIDEGGHFRLYSFDLADQSINWTFESEDGYPKRIYANDETVTFIGYQDFANGVDAKKGVLNWRYQTANWVPSFMGSGDGIYFGSANTQIHAISLEDGSTLWLHDIAEGTFNYVMGAPMHIGDSLYFLTQHGDIMALDIDDGSLRWHVSTEINSRSGLTISEDGWIFIAAIEGEVHGFRLAD